MIKCMKIWISILTVILAIATYAWAGDRHGNCDVLFYGTSNVHDFSGTVNCRPFVTSIMVDTSSGMIFQSVEVEVPVNEMDTQNESRDKKLRKMFQSDEFPYIRAFARNVDPNMVRQEIKESENNNGNLYLILKILDIEHQIKAKVSNLKESAQEVSFDMEFPVSLKSYGFKPPSALFGLIRVDDKVIVKVTVRLEASADEIFSK